jgi:inosine-uridine nucleoside N-ribohydrolase
MIKLFIDTDFGGDVDDALALTAAILSPELEIVGISTVYLRPYWRAQTVGNVLRHYGREVPVAVGCGEPISGAWDEKNIPDTGVLPDKEYPVRTLHGCDLLLETARRYPDMTILAVGPLTNLGLALLKDRKALAGCKIVMMGGRIFNAQPEWNIQCDPEAASLVLSSGLPITLVPFDVTRQCQFTQDEVDAFTGTVNRDFLRGMMNAFTQKFGFLPMMHDPMALAMLVVPHLFTFEQHKILVETKGSLTRGTLVDFGQKEDGNVRVAVASDQPDFRSWIKEILMRG